MACLFLSSIPFLDLIDSFILLAAEVVAIIYLNEEAHSAFWFMWTVNRSYPYNYFFNDHPNAGVRSYDYIYSVMGVISLGLMSCSQLCLIPLQFKALCGGGDGEGGPTLSGIGMPNM